MNDILTIFNDIAQYIKSQAFLQQLRIADEATARALIVQSIGEAGWAIEFLQKYNLSGSHVLEAGSGAGIVSACLHLCGAQVTMVEPSSGVFDYQHALCAALHAHLDIHLPLISVPVEDIQPREPHYDFIFSINVLEHIMHLPQAFDVMSRLLKDDGMMLHICPNYIIPYEPHVGVLLVPFFPRATLFLSKKLKSHPVSAQLNFITVRTIQKLARRNNLVVHFYKDMMYRSFLRLESDSQFQKRQSGLPLRIFGLLKTLRLLHLTRYVPVCLQTPVAFELKKDGRHGAW